MKQKGEGSPWCVVCEVSVVLKIATLIASLLLCSAVHCDSVHSFTLQYSASQRIEVRIAIATISSHTHTHSNRTAPDRIATPRKTNHQHTVAHADTTPHYHTILHHTMKFTAAIALVGLVAAAQAAPTPLKMDAVLSNDDPSATYLSAPRMMSVPGKVRRWLHL